MSEKATIKTLFKRFPLKSGEKWIVALIIKLFTFKKTWLHES